MSARGEVLLLRKEFFRIELAFPFPCGAANCQAFDSAPRRAEGGTSERKCQPRRVFGAFGDGSKCRLIFPNEFKVFSKVNYLL